MPTASSEANSSRPVFNRDFCFLLASFLFASFLIYTHHSLIFSVSFLTFLPISVLYFFSISMCYFLPSLTFFHFFFFPCILYSVFSPLFSFSVICLYPSVFPSLSFFPSFFASLRLSFYSSLSSPFPSCYILFFNTDNVNLRF